MLALQTGRGGVRASRLVARGMASGKGKKKGKKAKHASAAATTASMTAAQRNRKIVLSVSEASQVLADGRVLFHDVRFALHEGEKIGLLGSNGAGKSSLLRFLAGANDEAEGEVVRRTGVSVGYLPQEPVLDTSASVHDNILAGAADVVELIGQFHSLSDAVVAESDAQAQMKLLEQQEELEQQLERRDAWSLERRAASLARSLRCPPGDRACAGLSGGEARRVALARLLLSQPDVLLLDEPTNHLDADSVAWLERFVRAYSGAVIMVTHDRYFLDNVTNRMLELARGELWSFQGNYSTFLEAKQSRLEHSRNREQALARQVDRELAWIRTAPRARQAKSKARMASYEMLVEQCKAARVAATETRSLAIPPGPRLGDVVLECDAVAKAVDGGRQLFGQQGLSFKLPRGAIMGIVGPNGTGKTTLMRMITGETTPDDGTVTTGASVHIGYVSQCRGTLDDHRTVFEEIAGGDAVVDMGNGYSMPARAYVAAFNFRGASQEKPVGSLSGGERNRVHMAKLLRSGCNLLLLDEPTNDLDLDTLRALEEALPSFPGCAVIVSHDRWFLDRVCTHTLAYDEPSACWHFHVGSYSDYRRHVEHRANEETASAATAVSAAVAAADDRDGGATIQV